MLNRLRRLTLSLSLLAILSACGAATPTSAPVAPPVATAAPRDTALQVAGGAAVAEDAVASTFTLYSPTLGRDTRYIAVYPRAMEPGRAYPVLYLLHGAFGSYVDWTKNTDLIRIHGGRPLIVVTPDGSPFGWYADSPHKENSNYESFVTKDLIADVDSRFSTIRSREGRGIAGLSMGGHGAITLAAKHPDLFSSASSMSGILNLVNHADPIPHAERWHLNEVLGRYAENKNLWREHSAWHLVDRFANADVALLFDTGDKDSVGAAKDGRQFHERLTNRAIVHTYREFPGTHNWVYWGKHVGEHIEFHLANFADRAKGTPPETGQRIDDNKWHRRYVDRTLAFEKENEEKWSLPDAERPLVLLGSSSVEHMELYKDFDDYTVANRGISSDGLGLRSRGILHRLYCSAIDCRPRAVVLMNGTNDLPGTARTGKPSMDEVVEAYHEIVRRIRKDVPDAYILVAACVPTSLKYEYMADEVREYAERLRKIAEEEGDRVIYVDTWTPFADENGRLRAEFTNDGLHLNKQGHADLRVVMAKAFAEIGIQPNPAK